MPYLLRVRLPDHPGALGALALALGDIGADIESLVVVDHADGEAIDDLVVALPSLTMAESLVTAVHDVPGAVLETIRRHPGRAGVHDELALLDAAAASDFPLRTLVNGLPDLFGAQYAIAVDAHRPPAAVVTSVAAPESPVRVDWLPLTTTREMAAAELLDEPRAAGPDCRLVAAPAGPTAGVALARNGGPPFRPSELLRLAHLASVFAIARDQLPQGLSAGASASGVDGTP